MLYPIKVADIELSQSIPTFENLEGYVAFLGLVRLHGVPLGYVRAPVVSGKCLRETLSERIFQEHREAISRYLLENGLASPQRSGEFDLEALVNLPAAESAVLWPSVTVAVCTRERPQDLQRCLAAIAQLDYPHLDILVVDNAPTSEATKEFVANAYPHVRYVREPRPGLDWARNRAILEATSDILAFTDDDVIVDRGWVKEIARTFAYNPEVAAVTGLVVPYELETEAQVLFEHYGGFGRGFQSQLYRRQLAQSWLWQWLGVEQARTERRPLPWQWLGAGQFGTGANMAYRRSVFAQIGYFDPALDVGTPTNGGGDLEMFVRVLLSGRALAYESRAIVRHRHRREYAQLRRQIAANGSLYALWSSLAVAYPRLAGSCLKVAVWWMLSWNLRRTLSALLHPTQFPRDLVLAELRGAFAGMLAYPRSRARAAAIARECGWPAGEPLPFRLAPSAVEPAGSEAIAVRTVALSEPLRPLEDLDEYALTRIFATWHGKAIGSFDYANGYREIAIAPLSRAIAETFGSRLLDLPDAAAEPAASNATQAQAMAALSRVPCLGRKTPLPALPDEIPVSVVVATFDRPDDLRHCLHHLQAQRTRRPLEIVIVDNHPESGLTAPVASEFAGVVLVAEPRQGLAYARNAGFVASRGEIVVTTDDDVTVPPDWLETLVRPFVRPDVVAVTGNVLPLELETKYQQAFENYGGLGRGFESFEVNGEWYDLHPHKPSPTWTLGATANAAFRATIFSHPAIGLMDECLGPGMPSGVGEDTYLFYKVLKAGYTIAYEPEAHVWHKHRRSAGALRKQLYGYSKGHVAYNLTTWLRDGDWRGLSQVLLGLPYAHFYRLKEYMLGRSDYPPFLVGLELLGNLAGSWSLWRSRLRVRREGRSEPYGHCRDRRALPFPPLPKQFVSDGGSPAARAVCPQLPVRPYPTPGSQQDRQ